MIFSLLFKCALVVLLTPHSNFSIERVFSLVNKNKSESSDRNRLDIGRSLSSILVVKLDRPESVSSYLNYDTDDKLLHATKKATVNYKKRVTGQGTISQGTILLFRSFFMKKFQKEKKTIASLFSEFLFLLCSLLLIALTSCCNYRYSKRLCNIRSRIFPYMEYALP